MRVRTSRRLLVLCAAILMPALAGLCGDAPSAPAPSQPAAPKASRARPEALKRMEGDLFGSFKGLDDSVSLNPVLPPPNRAANAVIDKKAIERAERRRDWAFMSPDEILNGALDDLNPGNNPEKEDSSLSPVEQYYLRLAKKPAKPAVAKELNRDEDSFDAQHSLLDPQGLGGKDNSQLPGIFSGTERKLKSLMSKSGDDPVASAAKSQGVLADIFGLARPEPTPEEKEAQKARLEAFKQLLDSPSPAATDLSLMPGKSPAGFANNGTGRFSSGFGASTPASDVPFGTVAGLPKVGVLQDQNAKALSVPGVTPLPKTEAPKSYFIQTPDFSAPKRAF